MRHSDDQFLLGAKWAVKVLFENNPKLSECISVNEALHQIASAAKDRFEDRREINRSSGFARRGI